MTTRPLYRPGQPDTFPGLPATEPANPFPSRADLPLTADFPAFPLGEIIVTASADSRPLLVSYLYRNGLISQTDAVRSGLDSAALDASLGPQPADVDLWRVPLHLPIRDERDIRVSVRDMAHRHPDLPEAYEVSLLIEYIETNELLDALPADVAARVYADFEEAGVSFCYIDVRDYLDDPAYSLIPGLTRRLQTNPSHRPAA